MPEAGEKPPDGMGRTSLRRNIKSRTRTRECAITLA
jgi:hypothetical protein